MTKQFFQEKMKIIFADFGQTEYTPNRLQIIWEHCQDLPERSFAWIVTHFCRSKSVKYPPLPDHFIEAAMEQRKHLQGGTGTSRPAESLPQPSGEALDNVLKKLGVLNLTEAIKRRQVR